jgi:hypothetical protein
MPHQCTNCGTVFPDGSKEMLSGCPECGGNKFQFRPGASRTSDASGGETPPSETPRGEDRPADVRTTATGGEASESTDSPASAANATERGGNPPTSVGTDSDSGGTTVRDWVQKHVTDRTTKPSDAPEDSSIRDRSDGDEVDSTGDAQSRGDSTGDDGAATADAGGATADAEDNAQASARSDVVSPDELADAVGDAADGPPSGVDGRVIEPTSDERPGLDELREELNNQFESIRVINPGQYELNLMELYDREEYIISLQEDGRYVIEVPDAWDANDE